MFVQALFTQAVEPNAFLVPQAALQRDIGGDAFVFVVGAGNKAVRRKVAADRTFGTNWVVTPRPQAGRQGHHAGHRQSASTARRSSRCPQHAPQKVVPRQARQAGGGRGPAAAARPCRASSSTGRSSRGSSRSSSCSPGIGAIAALPIEQYPDIAPPQVNIRASYPGASARDDREQRHADHRAAADRDRRAALFQLVVELARVRSTSPSIFAKGTDPDIAQVQVQNQVQQAISRLPQQVQQQGVRVTKSNPDFLLIVAVYDETDQRTNMDVSDYLASNIQDPLSRVAGRRRRQRVRRAARDAHLAQSRSGSPPSR